MFRRAVTLAIMDTVRKLPFATSIFLDVVRFGAALMVACGHLTQSHFSVGWRDHTTLAVNAVGVFFVLSGFVIRYVTRLKYHQIGEYWIDRSARIYSVVLPAVLFTVLADGIARLVNPTYYFAGWAANTDHPLLRLLTNLTFTSQVWSHSVALFSNGPFWSLSYECFYYVLYGCAFYLANFRRLAAVILVAAVAGPHILLLLPLWLIGCAIFDLYEGTRDARVSSLLLHSMFVLAGVLGWFLWRPAHMWAFFLKSRLAQVFLAHHHQPINLHWTLDYYDVGLPFAFLMCWAAVSLERVHASAERSKVARAIRVMAEGTFPLYLFHFPLYVLIAAVIPYNHASVADKLTMLLTAVALSIALAHPTNQLKTLLRDTLRRRFVSRSRVMDVKPAKAAG